MRTTSPYGVSSVKSGTFSYSDGIALNIVGDNTRGSGLSVRCVQAFTFVAISFLFLIFAGDSDKSGVWQSD